MTSVKSVLTAPIFDLYFGRDEGKTLEQQINENVQVFCVFGVAALERVFQSDVGGLHVVRNQRPPATAL